MKMKSISTFVLGVIATLVVMAVGAFAIGPSMMIHEHRSPMGLDDTVNKIVENAKAEGWVVSGVKPLDEAIEKKGGKPVLPVRLIDLCEPHHASKILSVDDARFVSVMMPCTISVYEKEDGNIYIAHMNAGLMGRLFGGVISEVMSGPVTEQQDRFVDFAHNM
jgi:uncharacterized protein (DUF302 family)